MFAKVMKWLRGDDVPTPYFSTPAETICEQRWVSHLEQAFIDHEKKFGVPSTIPLETEKMSDAVNLDAMNVEGLTKFIDEQEKAHKEKQKALRALLRAKIALAPKTEAPAVG